MWLFDRQVQNVSNLWLQAQTQTDAESTGTEQGFVFTKRVIFCSTVFQLKSETHSH